MSHAITRHCAQALQDAPKKPRCVVHAKPVKKGEVSHAQGYCFKESSLAHSKIATEGLTQEEKDYVRRVYTTNVGKSAFTSGKIHVHAYDKEKRVDITPTNMFNILDWFVTCTGDGCYI